MMSTFGSIPLLGLLAAGAALGQSAVPSRQARPNLSGTWKLNLQRSGPIMPRGLEALTITIDHRDPLIRTTETRIVAGKVTKGDGTEIADGQERVTHPKPGETSKQIHRWSSDALLKHWEMTEAGTTHYISDIRITLSGDGTVLTMAEHYREPGMERIRDWVFEKQ